MDCELIQREEPHVTSMLTLHERALAVIRGNSLKDILKFQSQAEATKRYLKKHQHYREAAAQMSELSMRAARRGGELLAEMDKSKGAMGSGSNQHEVRSHDETAPTLADLGISKSQSSRWQAIAAIPEQTFEHHVRHHVDKHEPVTLKAILKLAPKKERTLKVVDDSPEPTRGTIVNSLEQLAGQKFATIMADPPWQYGNQATRASTDNHYVTMSVDDIRAMPISEYAADDAQLHLWTTNGFLRDAFQVMEAWGFEYRSVFVWCKPQLGIGNYWRVSHEFMLMGIRGSATFLDKSLKSWAELERGQHSKKPEAVRAMVEAAFHGPRLELFGRMAVPGWTVFGNEVERSLFAG